VSALILQAQQVSRAPTEWSTTFAVAAGLSVCIWMIGLVATEIAWRRNELARADSAPSP
jgi:hypothetical protein